MKLSQYAKKHSICYRTAFRHWKMGLIKGQQLETGTIVVFDEDESLKSEETGIPTEMKTKIKEKAPCN